MGGQCIKQVPSLDDRMDVDFLEYLFPSDPSVYRSEQRHIDLAAAVGQQRGHRRQQAGTRRPAMHFAVPVPDVRQRQFGVQMDYRRPKFSFYQFIGQVALLMLGC
jgi:hypothetical protein